LVRALDCHSRGRGFEPRRPRYAGVLVTWLVGDLDVIASACSAVTRSRTIEVTKSPQFFALVVKLVDTPS
jgi:hypothetical protein